MREVTIMRTVKDAAERKNEIMDAAEALFRQKGYEAATISDLVERLGIARGLIYYHFKSKEDILDAMLERAAASLLAAARKVAGDKSVATPERLLRTLMAMNAGDDALVEHLHSAGNALMHQKSHRLLLQGIPPILAEIISDGVAEGLFDTPYPHESIEMVIAYVNTVFDEHAGSYTAEELGARINAFIFNLERLFGAASGSFGLLRQLFEKRG